MKPLFKHILLFLVLLLFLIVTYRTDALPRSFYFPTSPPSPSTPNGGLLPALPALQPHQADERRVKLRESFLQTENALGGLGNVGFLEDVNEKQLQGIKRCLLEDNSADGRCGRAEQGLKVVLVGCVLSVFSFVLIRWRKCMLIIWYVGGM